MRRLCPWKTGSHLGDLCLGPGWLTQRPSNPIPAEFTSPEDPPTTHTLHLAHATRQGPLTAHPWSIPPGVWGPRRSGTPAPPLYQPGPPPPGQPRLQAPQVGLAEKGLGGCGEKSSAPTIPACPGPLPAHPSLLPPGPRGKLPKPLAKQPRLCASSAPALLFCITWSNSSDMAPGPLV